MYRPLTVDLSTVDGIADVFRTLSIHLTTDTEGSSQDLLHGALELLRKGFVSHGSCDLNDFIQRHRLRVFYVLLLFPVPWWFLQGPDDKRGCGRDDRDSCLPVLDREFDRHPEALLEDSK